MNPFVGIILGFLIAAVSYYVTDFCFDYFYEYKNFKKYTILDAMDGNFTCIYKITFNKFVEMQSDRKFYIKYETFHDFKDEYTFFSKNRVVFDNQLYLFASYKDYRKYIKFVNENLKKSKETIKIKEV